MRQTSPISSLKITECLQSSSSSAPFSAGEEFTEVSLRDRQCVRWCYKLAGKIEGSKNMGILETCNKDVKCKNEYFQLISIAKKLSI